MSVNVNENNSGNAVANAKMQSNSATDIKDIKKSDSTDNNEDVDTCVVCFKTLEIYSIGECDHPVCYECSTRMRALCQQNECPICRQMLNKVIFTYDKLPYRELESKNRSEYYNRKYKISFSNSEIQQRFFTLLDHPCPKCNCLPYRTFQGLRNHVKREHDMLYCDLCVENLKIFTFERRCYTQSELNIHRTRGDADNKSHRGHPLCEYCNKRYLDRDELFRHLRREHYFCHFCDADGCNEFYRDYDALADHFRQDHFLCEEGRCATEQFVGAFRTEIDYKAHVASVHGNTLNKQQAKQTRTLQLEITLGPRSSRSNQHEPASLRSRRNHSESSEEADAYVNLRQQQQSQQTIDARNEEDFPSLLSTNSGPNMTLVAPPPPPLALRRNGVSGLARTKENFPELGSGGGGGGSVGGGGNYAQKQRGTGQPIAAMLKKVPNPTTNSAITTARPMSTTTTTINANNPGTTGMMIHLSNRPQSSNNSNAHLLAKKSAANDFPALPLSSGAKSKKSKQQQQRSLEEDMLPSSSGNSSLSGVVAAKHRTLVEDYVSVANPKNFQKIQTVQQNSSDGDSQNGRNSSTEITKSVPKLSSSEFPSLSGPKSNKANNNNNQNLNWAKPLSSKKQRELENRKAKVAPAPLLHTTSSSVNANSQKSISNNSANSKQNGVNKSNSVGANTSVQSQQKKTQQQQSQHKLQLSSNESEKKDKKNNKDNKSGNTTKENNSQQQQQQQSNGKLTNNNNSNNNYNHNKSNSSQNLQAQETLRQQNQSLQPPPGFNSNNEKKTINNNNNNNNNNNTFNENKNINPLNKTPNNQYLESMPSQLPSTSTYTSSTPPPGFQTNVIVNSVARSPNNLTFTTSLGESFNIIPKHIYSPLPDSTARNQNLVVLFKNAMSNNIEAFEEFRRISQLFREGSYKASAFYEHCQSALGSKFDVIFPELLALLPDITKQQALYLVHTQRINALPAEDRKKIPKVEVCATCKQVLLTNDAVKHRGMHEFPTLLGSGKKK